MDVLADIFGASLQSSEIFLQDDMIFVRSFNKVKQCYKHMCTILSKKDLKTLDKLIASINTESDRKSVLSFEAGFKAGFNIATKLLQTENTPEN